MAAFDYKKEYKEFYLPPKTPSLVSVPKMNFVAVRGEGDPNAENGEYKAAIGILYGIAFTVKMSKLGNLKFNGYFDYVVPPLEGLWYQDGSVSIDYSRKDKFKWISMIRLPEFISEADFALAVKTAEKKKNSDFSKAEFFTYNEGFCVQCMHIGSYGNEPETIRKMKSFAEENGYSSDLSGERLHHEIYLSDPRRCKTENLKTVIRQPIIKS